MPTVPKQVILILCGGTGPRLWPLSRATNPKQFLTLFNQHSLLQDTLVRARSLVPQSQVFLITNRRYLPKIKSDYRSLIPTKNIIAEPEKKNTAMAIIYATSVIQKRFPHCTITSIPSDHFIQNLPKYRKNLHQAHQEAASQNKIVLIGVPSKTHNPSYGHILTNSTNQVTKFVEKPTEKEYSTFKSDKTYWNTGIYTFSPETLENELLLHQPQYFQLGKQLKQANNQQQVSTIYKQSENLSIDVAISQKSNNLSLVSAQFTWSDVGEWKTIFSHLPHNNQGHASLQKTNFLSINSTNCLVSGHPSKMIGLVNVADLAIIDTKDGLLVCHLPDSDHVRDLVKSITGNKKTAKYFLGKSK